MTQVLLAAAESEPLMWADWIALAALGIALLVGGIDFMRGRAAANREVTRDDWQRKMVEEQAETQRKSYELALSVHEWQQQQALVPEPAAPKDELRRRIGLVVVSLGN